MHTSKFFTDSIKCFRILCSFIIYKCDYYIQPTKKKNQDIAHFSNYANFFDYSKMYSTPVAVLKTGIKSNAQRKWSIYLTKIMFFTCMKNDFPKNTFNNDLPICLL